MIDDGRPLHVAFGDHTVSVSGPTDVVESLARNFGAMCAPAARTVAGQLEVHAGAGRYEVRGDSDVNLEDGSPADVIRCVRFSIIQLLIQARPDLLWLHAGAVGRRDGAMLCPGERGLGKSTLVTTLVARGWTYLSDDVVPWDPTTGALLPFPVAPAVRRHPGKTMPDWWLREQNKEDVVLPAESVATRPVTAVVIALLGESVRATAPPHSVVALRLLESTWSNARSPAEVTRAVALASLPARWCSVTVPGDIAALEAWADSWV